MEGVKRTAIISTAELMIGVGGMLADSHVSPESHGEEHVLLALASAAFAFRGLSRLRTIAYEQLMRVPNADPAEWSDPTGAQMNNDRTPNGDSA